MEDLMSTADNKGTTCDRLSYVRKIIRNVPDFPKPGILFKDISTLLSDPKAFAITIDAFVEQFMGQRLDAIVGVESRGFIFGAALAHRLNVSFVPVRKPGKLPAKVDRVAYSLEYGQAELEMHLDALHKGARVVIIDDLLATGGTAAAAAELVGRREAEVVSFAFVVELSFLQGRGKLGQSPCYSLVSYGADE
jgi:adenine phosphoribosyltransferase